MAEQPIELNSVPEEHLPDVTPIPWEVEPPDAKTIPTVEFPTFNASHITPLATRSTLAGPQGITLPTLTSTDKVFDPNTFAGSNIHETTNSILVAPTTDGLHSSFTNTEGNNLVPYNPDSLELTDDLQIADINHWAKVWGLGKPTDFADKTSLNTSANTAMVGSIPADQIAQSHIDFNSSNNQNSDAISAPTNLSLTHQANTDGSVDLQLTWDWSGNTADIDGFSVLFYLTRSNPYGAVHTLLSTDSGLVVPAKVRKTTFTACAADIYYTVGVTAYRKVDANVMYQGMNANGLIQSATAQVNNYQPAATPNYLGNLGGKPVATVVSDGDYAVAQLNGLLADNTLLPNEKQQISQGWAGIQAEHASIVALAQTTPYYSQLISEYSDYVAAYNTLSTYLTGSGGILVDLTTTATSVNSLLFKQYLSNYYSKKQILSNKFHEVNQSTAQEAKVLASNARSSAEDALSYMKGAVVDHILDEVEKANMKKERDDNITPEYNSFIGTATTLGITTEKTAYTTAYNNLISMLNTYIDTSGNTDITGSEASIVAVTQAYYDARRALEAKFITLPWDLATTVQAANNILVSDFNAQDNFNATAIVSPTNLSVTSTLRDNGSATYRLNWTWAGNEGDIEGFIIHYRTSLADDGYVLGSSSGTDDALVVSASARLCRFNVAANLYLLAGVKAYRSVDKSIASSGRIESTLAVAAIHRPAASCNISGTVNNVPAATLTNNTNAAYQFSLSMLDDLTISAGVEKQSLRADWDAAYAEKAGLLAQASLLSVSSSAYSTAFQNVANDLNLVGTYGAWTSGIPFMISDAQIGIDQILTSGIRATMKSNMTTFMTERTALLLALNSKASTTAVYANVTNTPTSLSGINSTEGTKLSGIATGATKNLITVAAVDPTGGSDGDIAYNSATGRLFTKIAGVWTQNSTNTTASSGTAVPTGGNDGDVYYRTSTGVLYTKVAGVWTPGATYHLHTEGTGTPSGGTLGDTYYNTATGILYVNNGSTWTQSADKTSLNTAADTAKVNGVLASSITSAVTNFNSSNDRNSSAIAAPTGVTLSNVQKSVGTVDLTVTWAWAGSEGDIDGFGIYVKTQASNSAYTLGQTSDIVYIVPASARSFTGLSVAGDLWYTIGVRAYRAVDKDIAVSGLIASGITQAANYQPTATPNITSNINSVAASTLTQQAGAGGAAALTVADMNADTKLTPIEKLAIRREWDIVSNEKAGINAQATALGITTENTNYNTAFQAIANYLNNGVTWTTGVPTWISDANLSTTTDIVGATYRSTVKAYYDARTALINKMADVASTKATWSSVTGTGKPADSATKNIVTSGTTAPVSPADGDVWVDTNSPVTIKTRVSGAWVAGGNVPTALSHVNSTEATKLSGIATGATANIVTTGVLSARPTGANGDFYFATDTNILYQKISGSWVTSATVGAPSGTYIGSTLAQTVESNAATALTNAANAQTTANAANSAVADMSADNKLTPVEKSAIRSEWDILAAEKAGLNAQAATLGITTENTTYNTNFQALATYLNAGTAWTTGIPSWISDANLATTTDIAGATFRSTVKAYYDARTALINKFADIAATKAVYSNVTGTPTSLSGINATEGTKLSGVATGATKNTLTTGLLSARPTGSDGDFYFATDTNILYQKISGSWVTSATVGAPSGTYIGSTLAQTVESNAATALTNAANAQTTANAANSAVADMSADNKLTPVEKSAIRSEWDILAAEKAGLNAQAATLGITTENTTYNTNFQALATYLNAGTAWTTGIPSWISDANLATTTDIAGATFRSTVKAYYDARTALINKFADIAATKAVYSNVTGTPTSLSGINATEGTKLSGVATGATKNTLTTGLLSARPTGSDGDFYFATDTNILYQKISGSWVTSATVGAPSGTYIGSTLAQTVESNAATALTNAANAQTTANAANSAVADMSADNKLTPVEKSAIRSEWDILAAEKAGLNAQAATLGITTENTTYNTNFQALATYLNAGTAWTTGIPSWISDANLATTTDIAGATFRSTVKAYYDARTALINKFADIAATKAVYSNVTGTPTSLSGINATEGTKLSGVATGATKNTLTTGLLSARPTGSDGDFYFATDTNILYQKISGSWVTSATVGAPSGTYIGSTLAQTVESNAATALTNAANAQTTANAANSAVADMSADNKLTPVEKSAIRSEWDILAAEKAGLNAQAATLGITTENTTYNTNFQALATYLNAGTAWTTGIPSWISDANLATTTDIAGATFRSTVKAYYDARTALINKFADIAATKAVYSNVTGTPTSLSGINATEGTKLSGVATGATKNTLTTGLLSAVPTGSDGDFFFATDTKTLYQKISGSWVTSATVGAPSGTLVGSTAATTVESNASAGNTAATDTATFRTGGVPTNQPTIGAVTVGSASAAGLVNITLAWSYTQGTLPADEFVIYAVEGTTAPTTSSPVVAKVSGSDRSVLLQGVPMDKNYRAGIVACRKSKNGVESGAIVTGWARDGVAAAVAATAAPWSGISGTGKPEDYATATTNSGNRVVNSEFLTSTNGWNFWNPYGISSFSFNLGGWTLLTSGTAYMAEGADTGRAALVTGTIYQDISVEAGKKYELSGLSGAHRCSTTIYIEWYNSSSAQVGISSTSNNAAAMSGGTYISGYYKHTGVTIAPAGAVFARVCLTKYGTTSAQTSSYAFFAQVQLKEALSSQTVATAYGPGPGTLPSSIVNSTAIQDSAVSNLKIAAQAVTAAKTAIAAIDPSTGNLTANSVTANNIVAGTITGDKIQAGSITSVGTVTAGSFDTTGYGRFQGYTTLPDGKTYTVVVNDSLQRQVGVKGYGSFVGLDGEVFGTATGSYGVRGVCNAAGQMGVLGQSTHVDGYGVRATAWSYGIALDVVGRMQISSTALVTNLNADRLDDYHASDFVKNNTGNGLSMTWAADAGSGTSTLGKTHTYWLRLIIDSTTFYIPLFQ